ncbi:L,D-transpeptidase family protein [Steroidobacter denitrificans]|nr:L,D-transpeptidase family protein [Steroidobacter denitrificans]
MNTSIRRVSVLAVVLVAAWGLTGCQLMYSQESATALIPPSKPEVYAPAATHQFHFDPKLDDVVGVLQITHVQGEDTLSDIARRFNLGYEEIVRANPGVDPWLPGEGRAIVLPTQFVLPKAPREGVVINLAQLRAYYYPRRRKDEVLQTVITHPIGIGKVGWSTPLGTTKVTLKQRNPIWIPPASVRKEHAKAGDPLPARVLPGPDNPLGAHKLTLGWPSYLMHGTNKPYGVGMRSSHGCIRFYPEDIAQLFEAIPVGTKVTVVNQPFVFGWHGDALYAQAFPILEDDGRKHPNEASVLMNAAITDGMWKKIKEYGAVVNLARVDEVVEQARGIALPVSRADLAIDAFLADARQVENRLPEGANWDGRDELLVTAEEFEAALSGTPLPKQPPAAESSAGRAANSLPAGGSH